jgi:hypothetical protein
LIHSDTNQRLGEAFVTPPASPPPSPPRGLTPLRDGPIVGLDHPQHDAWNPSPSDIIPHFLTDALWKSIDGKHIHVALGPKFGGGGCIGYTKFPLEFDNPFHPSKVATYWTDNKGRWQQDDLSFQDLTPAHPKKNKVSVVVIDGDRKGQVFQVIKVTRADGTVILAAKPKPQKELAVNLCVVEDHLGTGCTCSRLP